MSAALDNSPGGAVLQPMAETAVRAPSGDLFSGRELVIHIAQHCPRGYHWERTDGAPRMKRTPLTKNHVYGHCSGIGPAIGLALITPGTSETRITVFDLDSHKGETPFPQMIETAQRIVRVAQARGMLLSPFRSSGGAGIHLIALWDTPQDAYSVRELMRSILAECGLTDGAGKGVAGGQCECFPKQNEVAADRFGSMFVLPLAGESVPIDPETWGLLPKDAEVPLPASRPVPVLEKPEPAPKSSAPLSKGLAELQSMLAVVDPNALDYDDWRDIGYALHSATGGSEEGLALYLGWSARNEDKHDPEFAEREVWNRARNREDGITVRTLEMKAREHYNVADDFEVLTDGGVTRSITTAPRSALHLLRTEFKPVMFTIANLLPEGVFLLVASPKVGKSWLALQIGLAVASGGEVLGERAKEGDVLMLALEDNDRRLQSRLKILDAGRLPETALARIQFETEWPRVNEGGAKRIEGWLDAHPGARLVVIDVLERIRPKRDAKANAYGEDYAALKELKAIADNRQISLIVVHHTRKAISDDAMQLVSGTQGLAGAADGVLVLARARGESRGELHVMARDLEREGAFAVEFTGGRWEMVGPAHAVATTEGQQQLLDVLRGQGAMTPAQLGELVGKSRQAVQRVLARMVRDGLVQHAGVKYAIANPDDLSVVDQGESLLRCPYQ